METANPFRRIDPHVLDDDIFWSQVRRRHRDVDLVLLPPPPAADEAGSRPSPAGAVHDAAAGLVDAWHLVASLLPGPRDADDPPVRWAARDQGHVLLIEEVVRGLGIEGGTALLRSIAYALGRAGWRLAPAGRGDHPLLQATDGHVVLRAEAGAGATALRLATGALVTDDATRAAVRRELVEEVASWV